MNMKTMRAFTTIAITAVLLAGCATAPKIGDGKLEPTTKTALDIASGAAALAAPEYAELIQSVKGRLSSGGTETADSMLSDAEFFAIAKRLGFIVSLVYRVDGAIVPGESVSWTWAISRSHTGADAIPPSPEEVADLVDGAGETPDGIDARIDEAFERMEAKSKKAK